MLEVGGGQRPHPRADVVIDKYVANDFERAGEAPLDLSRPLIVGDGHALPLASGSVAYVIAAHVLEHATDPNAFANELGRIALAGYVQVPSRAAELTFEWPFHPWLIDCVGDCLSFEPKAGRHAPIGADFHRWFAQSPTFRLWWAAGRSRWLHTIHWTGCPSVTVTGAAEAAATASIDLERAEGTLRRASRGRDLGPPESVAPLLRCPVCGGGVAFRSERIACRECGRAYPVHAGVPILLAEAAS